MRRHPHDIHGRRRAPRDGQIMAKGKRSKGKGKRRERTGQPARSEAKSPRTETKSTRTETKGTRDAPPRRRRLPDWPLLALALAGMALSGYLALTGLLGAQPAYCTEGSACDIVQASRWGTLLGMPTALWGFGLYAVLGYIAWRVRDPRHHWQWAWLLALVGLAYSVYLTAVSVLVLEATCAYCLASLALLAAIFAVLTVRKPAPLPGFSWPVWGGQAAALAAVLVVGLHLHYSGVFDPAAGPEDPYLKALTRHLDETGAVFYGAYW